MMITLAQHNIAQLHCVHFDTYMTKSHVDDSVGIGEKREREREREQRERAERVDRERE